MIRPLFSGATVAVIKVLRLAEAVLQSWQREPRPAHDHEAIAYYQHVERKRGEPWSL